MTDTTIFLNGACDIFAQALHNLYGYPIYYILNKNKRLIHAYCKCNDKCIDVESIHTDEQKFIQKHVGSRKYYSIVLCDSYDLKPIKYNDIYTTENFKLAAKLASNKKYMIRRKT